MLHPIVLDYISQTSAKNVVRIFFLLQKKVLFSCLAINLYLMHVSDFDEHAFTKEQFINMERDDSRTALLLAAQLGEFEIMKTLISHGANIHSIASGKRSALHLAASSGNESAVNMLLEKGVCINLEDDDGRVPLHE